MVKNMEDVAEEIARLSFDSGFVKIDFDNLIDWPDGLRMPIYNDNSSWYYYPDKKKVLMGGFIRLMRAADVPDGVIIAGAASSGISLGTSLADRCGYPFVDIGEQGVVGLPYNNFKRRSVLVIEEVIATGKNLAKSVELVRERNGIVDRCLAVFDYGFEEAKELFMGNRTIDDVGRKLSPPCETFSLYNYDTLVRVGREVGYIDDKTFKALNSWREGIPHV